MILANGAKRHRSCYPFVHTPSHVKLSRYANKLHPILEFLVIRSSDSIMKDKETIYKDHQNQSSGIGKARSAAWSSFKKRAPLVEKSPINKEFVWECYSYYTKYYWAMIKKNVGQYCQSANDGGCFEHFERLKETMQTFSKK